MTTIERARAAAAELRQCLEVAQPGNEREQVARLISEVAGDRATTIAELAAESLASTFGTPAASSPPPSVRDAAGVPPTRPG